jgi:hypothetical protein
MGQRGIGSAGSGLEPVMHFSKPGGKPSGFIKCCEIFDGISTCQLAKK